MTGRPPMLPKALLGYVQSKERYVDQTEVLDTIREFGDRSIPLDVIVLDWRTWPEGLWGQKSLDGDRFPDPRLMIEEGSPGKRKEVSITRSG
ncbi:alpha-glucosidase (family GH31 glycosyl hydrolase) [Arthrobacter pascens]|uniref:TIM-barrel domain-containing protein n=1 Tax=Arthrobacter pascens TaxID=1677 RepID=UPI002784E64D|nr:alpha-glucosidase (family GH31 glycosyl hydrolase) [Arthrobacter pascens]